MSDTREKIKDGIDDAAHKAKQATDTVAEKAKDAGESRPVFEEFSRRRREACQRGFLAALRVSR